MPPAGATSITFVTDSRNVERMLERVSDALDTVGMYAFLNSSVGPWLRERAQERFANEGDDVVGQWAPLQAYTVQMRESQGFPGEHPINRRTGELESYIVSGGWDVSASPILSTLTYPGNLPSGSQAVKVAAAQMGVTNPSTVPRPVLGLNEADLAFVMAALGTHVILAGRSI